MLSEWQESGGATCLPAPSVIKRELNALDAQDGPTRNVEGGNEHGEVDEREKGLDKPDGRGQEPPAGGAVPAVSRTYRILSQQRQAAAKAYAKGKRNRKRRRSSRRRS